MQLAVSRVGCRVPIRHSSAVVYVVSFAPSERPPPGIKPPFEGNGRRRRHPKGRLQAGARSVRLSPPVLPRPTARRVGPAPPARILLDARTSARRPAAVHHERRPGEHRGSRPEEIRDRVGDLGGLEHPLRAPAARGARPRARAPPASRGREPGRRSAPRRAASARSRDRRRSRGSRPALPRARGSSRARAPRASRTRTPP